MKNIWVPVSGQIAQQRKVETLANNIANANTSGFKRDEITFKEHLSAEVHYKRYFAAGVLIGGGASYTEFTTSNFEEDDRSNYYLIGSPYITLGMPITKTT